MSEYRSNNSRNKSLEEVAQEVIEETRTMTKEDIVAQFQRIGVLTIDGEFAPEFQNLKYWKPA